MYTKTYKHKTYYILHITNICKYVVNYVRNIFVSNMQYVFLFLNMFFLLWVLLIDIFFAVWKVSYNFFLFRPNIILL